MRAAATERAGCMVLTEQPEPPPPGQGRVVIRPEAVGICGSDYHFFGAHLSDAAGAISNPAELTTPRPEARGFQPSPAGVPVSLPTARRRFRSV